MSEQRYSISILEVEKGKYSFMVVPSVRIMFPENEVFELKGNYTKEDAERVQESLSTMPEEVKGSVVQRLQQGGPDVIKF